MKQLFLLQTIVPAAFIVWMLFWPGRNAIVLALQLLASLLALHVLSRIGIWLFPPWWIPHATAVVVTGLALRATRRSGFTWARPTQIRSWVPAGFWSVAIVALVPAAVTVARGSRLPESVSVVDLEFPLAGDRFLVVNGGSVVERNSHMQSLDSSILRLQPWRGNAYATDVVAISAIGLRTRGVYPRDPAQYRIFGAAIRAPCAGAVVQAVDGLPDMPVPEYDREHLAGNHVILRCMDVEVILAHMRQGSVRVHVGDSVATHALLGEVGNSGGTDEPHLHIHAQRPATNGAPMSGDPLATRFTGRFLARSDRLHPMP